jgi:hypothetical protein
MRRCMVVIKYNKFLIDVEDGKMTFILKTEMENGALTDEDIDKVYDLVEGYLRSEGHSYEYFNVIDITDSPVVEI